MESTKTKIEWKVLKGQFPLGTISINEVETNKRVCTLNFDTNIERRKVEDNAAYIVKAVNSHEELVDIAKRCSFLFGNEANYPEGTIGYRIANDAKAILEKVNANT